MKRIAGFLAAAWLVGIGPGVALGQSPTGNDEVTVVLIDAGRATLLLNDGRAYDARGPVTKRDGLILFHMADGRPASIRGDEVREVRAGSRAAGATLAPPRPPAPSGLPAPAPTPAPVAARPASADSYTNEDLPPSPEPVEADASQPPFATEPVPEKPQEDVPAGEPEPPVEEGGSAADGDSPS